ncbi:MAG TPA: anti-sigma factor [Actinomycetota bacterium]|nr:anti-sigma factor [Actinomycetota bacterium]
MTERDHTTIDELLAARALDGLDERDAVRLEREFEAHGDCAECRRLEAEHAEVAGMLALALEPRPTDERVVDRILAAPADEAVSDASSDELAARRDAPAGPWRAAFAVAAAVALALAFVLAMRPDGPATVPATIVSFDGSPGELAMAYTPGERGALVWGTGLPDPGEGKVYEVWMIEEGDPVRGGCLSPTDGAGATYLDADVSSAELMAVTVESADCPDVPTTDPTYTAELV